MNLRWHEEAKAEVHAATAFYHDKQPGFAQRFLDSLEDAPAPDTTPPAGLPASGRGHTQVPGASLSLWRDLPGAIRVYRNHRRYARAQIAGVLERARFMNETLAE